MFSHKIHHNSYHIGYTKFWTGTQTSLFMTKKPSTHLHVPSVLYIYQIKLLVAPGGLGQSVISSTPGWHRNILTR